MPSIANEAAFVRFMQENGPSSKDSKRNYLSWLRYVSELYNVDYDNLNEEDVENIFLQLKETQNTREKYTSNSAVSDIKSALNKYLAFITRNENVSDIVSDISLIIDSGATTTKAEIETRLGQGNYRQGVIALWLKCAVTGFDHIDLLIASHIKPWRESSNLERVDPNNGLLLSPSLDKLFDRGYISFTDDGSLITSPLIDLQDLRKLGVNDTMKLYKVEAACLPYLKFHREHIFIRQI